MAEGKKSFGNKLQKKIRDAADAVKDAAEDVDLSDIEVPEKIKKAAMSIDKGVKKTVHSAKEKVEEIDLPDLRKNESVGVPEEIDGAKVLSTTAALRLIYYLMAVNGDIYHAEEEKFDLIGKELDPNFKENREKIVKRCQTHLERTKGQDDYFNVIKRGVVTAISLSKPTKDSFMTPKLLIWDLLSVAYSDDHYDETEKKLIRFIVNKLNVNESEFLEMESSFLTLVDIQREKDWIKTTDRQYKEIEKVVNELADRKVVILESVNDLITL